MGWDRRICVVCIKADDMPPVIKGRCCPSLAIHSLVLPISSLEKRNLPFL